jgi:hypothetical protein
VDSIGSEKSALLIDEQWFQQWVAFGMLELFYREGAKCLDLMRPVADQHNAVCCRARLHADVAAAMERMRIILPTFDPGQCDPDYPWCDGTGTQVRF